jgi:hypothetical protein
MTMMRHIAAVILVALIAGCSASAPHARRANVTAVGPWPTARPAAPNDPPKILAVRLSATRVRPGQDWIGRVATTKNVASLEVRAPSFTFSAPRPAFGQFAFRIHALYIPPLYRRIYTVEFIARNAAGAADERDVDVDFR